MHRPYLLFLLVCCIVIGCTPTPEQVAVAPTNTLQGPIVPTRAPTTTSEATNPSSDVTAEPTAAPNREATNTLAGATVQANLPTEAPSDTAVPPTRTNTAVAPTDEPTEAPTATNTPTDEPSPTAEPSYTPTDEPSPTAEPTDTTEPSRTPTNTTEPTATPTDVPTQTPSDTPPPTRTPRPTVPPTNTPAQTGNVLAVGELYTGATSFLPTAIEGEVTAFSDVTGTIDNRTPAKLYMYRGIGGEILNISLRALNSPLDPSLIVLDAEGREIVRNDDEGAESLSAAIRGLRLEESGTYIIVASRYGQQFGFTSGDFELSVSKGSGNTTPFGYYSDPIEYGDTVSGSITGDVSGSIYTFRGERGNVISIQMTATSGDLDPRLFLTDNLGTTLAYNDDDLVNLSTNSYIQEFILPTSGYYSILASHYLGAPNSGDFDLRLTLEERGDPDRVHAIYALLNLENSRTVRSDGQAFINFSVGDSVGEDGFEYRIDSLLTFYLPPLPENTSLDSATLELAPCFASGSGWQALGPLTVYQDEYGLLTEAADILRPSVAAAVLTEMNECEPVDLTDLARGAYRDDSQIQLRLMFRDTSANWQSDEVLLTPRLLLNLSE